MKRQLTDADKSVQKAGNQHRIPTPVFPPAVPNYGAGQPTGTETKPTEKAPKAHTSGHNQKNVVTTKHPPLVTIADVTGNNLF